MYSSRRQSRLGLDVEENSDSVDYSLVSLVSFRLC